MGDERRGRVTFGEVESGSCQKGTLGAKQGANVLQVVRLMGVSICEVDNEKRTSVV